MKLKILFKVIEKILIKTINYLYLMKIVIGECINIFKKRKLYKDIQLSKQEADEIQALWKKNYGKRISTRWHRLYQSYTGQYNKLYFPEVLYTAKLERKLNNLEVARTMSDKSFFPMYYRDVKNMRLPDTYMINNSGIFYTGDRKIITRKTAASLIGNKGEVIIKPTLDSSSGDSVALCNFINGNDQFTGKTIEEVFNSYKENYIIQEKIIPAGSLKELYPGSVNTFRVITYLIEDRLYHAPITLSMGRNGSHVDNIQAGGVSVAVSDEGVLNNEGYSQYGEVHKFHPDTGTVFEKYKLPEIGKLINVSKEMHEKTPHMRIISWDFTLDDKDNIVLLEFNISGQSVWFPQMVSGKAVFGENTEEMIRLIRR